MEVPQKINNRVTIGTSNPCSGYLPPHLETMICKYSQSHWNNLLHENRLEEDPQSSSGHVWSPQGQPTGPPSSMTALLTVSSSVQFVDCSCLVPFQMLCCCFLAFQVLVGSSAVRHLRIIISPVSKQSFNDLFLIVWVVFYLCNIKFEFLRLSFETFQNNYDYFCVNTGHA